MISAVGRAPLAAAVLAAGLVWTGSVADEPALAQDSTTDRGSPLADVEPVDNPPIEDACGVDLTLVLDASGSIQSADAVDDVRDAAGQFLEALADTDSRARVTQFASFTEELAPPTLITAESVAPGGIHREATTAYYSPKPPVPAGATIYNYDGNGSPFSEGSWEESPSSNQYTSWQTSLEQAAERTDDLVVYITDGEPTAYDFDRAGDPFGVEDPANVGVSTNRGDADEVMLDRSIEAANAVKDGGSRMLAIGVGDATTSNTLQERLTLISGPLIVEDLGTIESLNEVDVAIVENFDDLAQFLRSVVLELCSPSLTITKLAQSPVGAIYEPAEGWTPA